MILKELLLKEEEEAAELEKTLRGLFDNAESSGSLQPYVSSETIQARAAVQGENIHSNFPGEAAKTSSAKKTDFVVRHESDPSKLKLISGKELEENFQLVDADEVEDAEGFKTYQPKGELMAFEYGENAPLELKDENGKVIHVKHGDYLGYPSDDSSHLIHLDKSHFEKTYRLAD